MNELTIETVSPIVAAYNDEMAIDQTIPIQRRFERLSAVVVTDDPATIETAKTNRTALNALLKDASAPRMRVQRAIKAHPIGKFAFTKTQLEKDIEAASKHLGEAIDAHTKDAETISLRRDVKTWCCYITTDLPTLNKLAVELNERGIDFQNHGPIEG